MYYALAGIFGILMFVFLGLWQAKCKELERLRQQNRETEERNRVHALETQEYQETDKKRRDLIEIYLVTDAKPADCEKIYQKLIEQEKYGDFFYAETKKKRLNVINKLK